MDAARYQRLSKIFQKACDLRLEERDDYLSSACKSDPTLRAEVEALLARDSEDEPLELRVNDELIGHNPGSPVSHSIHIDNYRLLKPIGEGGMGEVWEAEQENPVRRRVALKLIKWGMDTKAVIARFEAEKQALAVMDHPSIAKVLDAGATDQGRPFFVMPYVPGDPITIACDSRRFGIAARLQLFVQVCDAIQHAHQKGVIHRDIKPSNVLVTAHGEKVSPVVIDFGIAKAVSQPLTEATLHTAAGHAIGTPQYMSPEQADITNADIDTRTDVYSLGALLYELLVGAPPFDREAGSSGLEEFRRQLIHEEPRRPSSRLSTLGDAREVAAKRSTEPRLLFRKLKSDLDWIVVRALEKDRDRRYGSPAELGADVQRYLDDMPVLAGPPTQRYRFAKFVRRHRAAVMVTALLSGAVAVGTAGTGLGLVRAKRAEATALQQATTAEATLDFLVKTLTLADPFEAPGQSMTAVELIDKASERMRNELDTQPDVQTRPMAAMAQVFVNLGSYERAGSLFGEALELRRAFANGDDPETATMLCGLAELEYFTGTVARAEEFGRQCIGIRKRTLGEKHAETVHAMVNSFASHALERDAPDIAEPVLREALTAQRQTLGEDHVDVGKTWWLLATARRQRRDYDRAWTFLQRAYDSTVRAAGVDHPQAAAIYESMSRVRRFQGRIDEAVELGRTAQEMQAKNFEDGNFWISMSRVYFGFILEEAGRLEEAETKYREVIAKAEARYGDEHPWLYLPLWNLGRVRARQGDLETAKALLDRARRLDVSRGSPAVRAFREAAYSAILGDSPRALSFLTQAVEGGYANASRIADEPDFASLRGVPEYESLIDRLTAEGQQDWVPLN